MGEAPPQGAVAVLEADASDTSSANAAVSAISAAAADAAATGDRTLPGSSSKRPLLWEEGVHDGLALGLDGPLPPAAAAVAPFLGCPGWLWREARAKAALLARRAGVRAARAAVAVAELAERDCRPSGALASVAAALTLLDAQGDDEPAALAVPHPLPLGAARLQSPTPPEAGTGGPRPVGALEAAAEATGEEWSAARAVEQAALDVVERLLARHPSLSGRFDATLPLRLASPSGDPALAAWAAVPTAAARVGEAHGGVEGGGSTAPGARWQSAAFRRGRLAALSAAAPPAATAGPTLAPRGVALRSGGGLTRAGEASGNVILGDGSGPAALPPLPPPPTEAAVAAAAKALSREAQAWTAADKQRRSLDAAATTHDINPRFGAKLDALVAHCLVVSAEPGSQGDCERVKRNGKKKALHCWGWGILLGEVLPLTTKRALLRVVVVVRWWSSAPGTRPCSWRPTRCAGVGSPPAPCCGRPPTPRATW
jgi:hypothetical protein